MCDCLSCVHHTGGLACNPGICPGWESNRRPFGLQASAQSTEPQQPGCWDQTLITHVRLYIRHLLLKGEKQIFSWPVPGGPALGQVTCPGTEAPIAERCSCCVQELRLTEEGLPRWTPKTPSCQCRDSGQPQGHTGAMQQGQWTQLSSARDEGCFLEQIALTGGLSSGSWVKQREEAGGLGKGLEAGETAHLAAAAAQELGRCTEGRPQVLSLLSQR